MDIKIFQVGEIMPILVIDTKTKILYLNSLIGKVYKILPLYENETNEIFKIYLGGLLIDINSANVLFDGILIDLIVKIHSIYVNDFDHKQVRKIVLECTNLVKKIRGELESGNNS